VVDNTEGDEETKRVAAEFGAHYVVEPKAGLSRARKRGLAECKSDAVAYLDDGVIPDSNWLSALLASFARQKALRSTGKLVNITSSSREANQESSKDPVEGDSR
jgi:glycosyltransferase involved in cell wall biosynthesis